jgi:hypothetical protein
MKRCFTPVIAIALILAVATVPAMADGPEKGTCYKVRCDIEKTDSGIRWTMIGTAESELSAIRECARSADWSGGIEGVTRTFEEVEGGIVITHIADTAEGVKELHAKADACAGMGSGSCPKGARGKDGCGKKCTPAGGPCCEKQGETA